MGAEALEEDVNIRARVLIAVFAGTSILGGFAPSAHALFGFHRSNQPRVQRKAKKNASLYAYLAPKKQKKPTGYYQSTVTGQILHGKKKK